MQLQTLDGTFHFVAKSDLEGLEYSSQTLMPSDYGSTLSPNELDAVVSYLMSVADASTSPAETHFQFLLTKNTCRLKYRTWSQKTTVEGDSA